MAKPGRVGDLEIASSLESERREWRAQRIGRVLMALVAGCALAGLMGPGPLSKAEAGDARLHVEYERFARYQGPGEFRIQAALPAGGTGALTLWIQHSLAEHIEVEEISPAPERQEVGSDRYLYRFASSGGEEGTALIKVRYQGNKFGTVSGSIGVENGPSVQVRQFYWP